MHHTFHPLYVDYCIYFNGNQDYFECHEVLEEYWKIVAPGDKNHVFVGFIQLATGLYHWRRNNFNGAIRTLQKAYVNFQANENSPYLIPIDKEDLVNHIEKSMIMITHHKPFQSFSITIKDSALQQIVQEAIRYLPSQDNHYIIHKHKLRNRDDILQARESKKRSRR